MDEHDLTHDPYKRCQDHCTHDLARGVLVAELLSADGPHADSHLILNFSLGRLLAGSQMASSDEEPPPLAAAG